MSERDLIGLRQDAKAALIAICKKLGKKTPLAYPLARSLSCLDPRNMASNPDQCKIMMKRLLASCVDGKHVMESDCDDILLEFTNFMHSVAKSDLESYNIEIDRLDTFLQSKMEAGFPKVWKVVRLALILSHGQATVERGFSINKELVTENQQQQSLVARRMIKDHIMHVGGVTNVEITHGMVVAARSARAKYMHELELRKEQEKAEEKRNKRKAEEVELKQLEDRKKRLKTDISDLISSSKQMYDKCESTGNVTFVTKANSLRRTAESKQKELDSLDKEIAERLLALKQ